MSPIRKRVPARAIAGLGGVLTWAAGLAVLLLKFGSHPAPDAPTQIVVPVQIVDIHTPPPPTSSVTTVPAPTPSAPSPSQAQATRQTATPVSTIDHESAHAARVSAATSRTEAAAPHRESSVSTPPTAPPATQPVTPVRSDVVPKLSRDVPENAATDAGARAHADANADADAAGHGGATTQDTTSTNADRHAGESANPDAHTRPSSGGATPGSANTSAQAIYQPLPEVPDEARDEALSAVALARFTVHTDGQCDVHLVQATRNPTLNRLLLASLRQWRFAPAMENGQHVESTIDLRVHFNIQ